MIGAIFKPVVKGCQQMSDSAQARREIAQRAAKIYKLNKAQTAIASGKATVVGGVTPIVDKVASVSDSFGVVAKTLGKMKRKGVKKAKPEIKEAVKEIAGINDIKAATEAGGVARGVLETGKAATRLTTTLGLFIAGNFVPFPGVSLVGWVTGEKLTNLLLGKPFTKQAKNLIK